MEKDYSYRALLDDVGQMIQVSDINTYEMLYANRPAIEYAGHGDTAYRGRKCYQYMMGLEEQCPFCPMRQMEDTTNFQCSEVDNGQEVYSVKTRKIQWEGHEAFLEYAQDITASSRLKESQAKATAADSKYQELYNNVQCGIFEYKQNGDSVEFLSVNPMALEMLGYTEEAFWAKRSWNLEELVYAKDLPAFRTACETAKKQKHMYYCYRNLRRDGTYFWMAGNLYHRKSNGEENSFLSVSIDIDAQKRAELELSAEREKMEITLNHSSITLWDYDVKTHCCTRSLHQRNPYGVPQKITVTAIAKQLEVIHPEDKAVYLALYRAMDEGQQANSAVLRLKDVNGAYCWVKVSLQRVIDAEGEEKVIGWSIDITDSVLAQQKLRDEMMRQETIDAENLLAKARFNLTKNKIELFSGVEGITLGLVGEPYDKWAELLIHHAVTAEQRAELTSILERAAAVRNFEKGDTKRSVDYQRSLVSGRQLWVRTTIHLYKDVHSGDLMSFMYSYDIDNEKVMQGILANINRSESEFFAVYYIKSDRLRVMYSTREEYMNTEHSYSEKVEAYIENLILPEDREKAAQAFSHKTLSEQLAKEKYYSIVFLVRQNGALRRKKWTFYYVDEGQNTVVLSRTDMTEIFHQQEQQQEMMESALLAARQASAAKSNFLSRMSHEIRTPMNAILGMCTLAAQAIDNEKEVADCISKIGISGHYLLTLINDILDMSRIESGKMLMHKNSFHMNELVSSINTIIYGQAEEKNIDYETIIDSNLEEAYIGDAMKLQQIMVNILGNAVKFTPSGGKITFTVHTSARNRAGIPIVTFKINDTGCGIRETDLDRIFEAFEQVDNSTTSEYNGTGLGLAISKNLIELMGGTIRCRSILDVGTEFTVQVPMEMSLSGKVSERRYYSFAKMNALIVDDDVIICESTSKTLAEIGMIPQWVVSGAEAIERVQAWFNQGKAFDYILIDWKMPEMDGIETARRIRKIVGSEVTIIIITSYDWVAIEREAKAAGANFCISKPMFKSTLVSAFEKSQKIAQEQKVLNQKAVYDFTGLRLLLAEDHPMNAEIASRLLKSKHCEIEIATNGLRALEAFTTNPVGYYDGILMDIRMPVMDGLQASANIRRWNKADAKTIPVIAMTANAFDEDVEKCMEAGMNAHLAKPIQPELLFHTIQRLIQSRETEQVD